MVARPFWLAHVGLISAEWNQLALSTTSETQLAGVLFRENDSPDGDVSKATKLLRRPMHPMRMGVCIRRILVQVCGVPPGEVGKFGVSSFRKFLIEICKARGLPAFRVNEVGRWSGSLAKDDNLMPIERVQGTFQERSVAMTDRYCHVGAVKSVCNHITEQLAAVRHSIARVGIENFPVTGGFDLVERESAV